MHIPTKPNAEGPRSANTQSGQRYFDTYHDQHKSPRFPAGRPWWGSREFTAEKGRADGFVGGDLTPGRHVDTDIGEDPVEAWKDSWHAPWFPEFRFFEFNHLRQRILLRYDKVQAYYKTELDKYFKAAAILAARNGWKEIEYGQMPSFAITSELGLPPMDAGKLAAACQAGDPWILGHAEEVNVQLAKVLGLSSSGLVMPQTHGFPTTNPDAVILSVANDPTMQALLKQMADMQATIAALTAPKKSHKKKDPAVAAA